MNNLQKHFDIILIGASLVGMSFLLALQELGLKILALEKEELKIAENIAEDQSRPITLSYGSVEQLKKLGVWENLTSQSTPILQVLVSQRGHFGTTKFTAAEEKISALGSVVPFNALKNSLVEKVLPLSSVTWVFTDSFNIIQTDSNGVTLSYTSENKKTETVSAELLVVAAGNNNALRQQLNITTTQQNHDQVAITAQVFFEAEHHDTGYERFNAPGILALLPMKNQNQCGLVWTVKKDSEIASNPSNEFLSSEIQLW